ncbi:MAG: hypothetical protein HC822_10870 [Oscillochloris sp.]|nr:hypothetical protein [Oscillochloris sp.]
MEALYETQSVLIGLIGWAATVLATTSASRLSLNERRMMIVCSWMLWMAPALGLLAAQGLISADMAALVAGGTTLLLAMAVMFGARQRPRTRP